jgi:ACR3 family arsenite efflux pump ArsB
VCDCSDQAAHYHNLGPKLGASLLTRHIGWKQKKKERKRKKSIAEIYQLNLTLVYNVFLVLIYFSVDGNVIFWLINKKPKARG